MEHNEQSYLRHIVHELQVELPRSLYSGTWPEHPAA